ncbi:MAG: prephenate dehydrogenase/arogenate dehydrogenase family protein [Thermaerobacter sp.]|nr:prephenate dehydrogenase/arogenate dehydrogenase family protein [Thermaerobacter sp.]
MRSRREGKHIAVFGLGLIGTSLALDLRAAGYRVSGYDAQAQHVALAAAQGALDEPLGAPVGTFDAVVLAAPPKANLALLGSKARAALILDTGSVKAEIVGRARARGLPFVGGHPLAGSEGGGPQAARRGLFSESGFALCPGGGPQAAAEELALAVGARPFWVDAVEHDRQVARSSHLVYAWSCALAEILKETPADLLGPAAREMLRVATSPPALWSEILEMNRAALMQAVSEAETALRHAAAGDVEQLALARETARRLREDGRIHGG